MSDAFTKIVDESQRREKIRRTLHKDQWRHSDSRQKNRSKNWGNRKTHWCEDWRKVHEKEQVRDKRKGMLWWKLEIRSTNRTNRMQSGSTRLQRWQQRRCESCIWKLYQSDGNEKMWNTQSIALRNQLHMYLWNSKARRSGTDTSDQQVCKKLNSMEERWEYNRFWMRKKDSIEKDWDSSSVRITKSKGLRCLPYKWATRRENITIDGQVIAKIDASGMLKYNRNEDIYEDVQTLMTKWLAKISSAVVKKGWKEEATTKNWLRVVKKKRQISRKFKCFSTARTA